MQNINTNSIISGAIGIGLGLLANSLIPSAGAQVTKLSDDTIQVTQQVTQQVNIDRITESYGQLYQSCGITLASLLNRMKQARDAGVTNASSTDLLQANNL